MPKRSPKCGHAHFVKKVFLTCDFVGLLIGGQKVILWMKGTLSRGYMPCMIVTSLQILDEPFLLVFFLKKKIVS